jgi:fatty acid kinase fatty acid binding subunit
MPRVAVVSDTTCYLPRELSEANGIGVVSLYVNFGGERTEPEAKLMERLDSVYEEIRSADHWPTTSQPSVGDFVSVYEPLLRDGHDVVSLHISAGLSGTCEAARQAAEALEREGNGGRVRVVDSATGAGGLGLLALVAAEEARAGAELDEVAERVGEAREALKIWFAIDTLEFLKRSGRVGAASAWIGSTLKIKPILTVESEITPVERVRTSGRAFERMVEYARQRHDSGADAWVVQHIRSPEAADELANRCREIFGNEPVFTSEVGPVLGVHTGPGLLGVGGLPAHFLS